MTQPTRVLGVTNTCNNCNFFEPPPTGAPLPLGRCHYAAPQQILQGQSEARAIWARCAPDDWCGQWQAIV